MLITAKFVNYFLVKKHFNCHLLRFYTNLVASARYFLKNSNECIPKLARSASFSGAQ
ncbi:MAG: hypothetical protein ACI86X_000764 [Moritella sp.]|jgi:hypothetical protein